MPRCQGLDRGQCLIYWCMPQKVSTGTLGNLCTSSAVSTNHIWYIFVLAGWTYEFGGHPREGGRAPPCVRLPTSINSPFVRKNISMGIAVKESDKLLKVKGSTSFKTPAMLFRNRPEWEVIIFGCIRYVRNYF